MSRAAGGPHPAAIAVEAVRFGVGLYHLVNARSVAGPHRPSPAHPDAVSVGFLRILGVRQMAQAALLLRNPTPDAHTLGALVDATHAASMVPFTIVSPRRTRLFAGQFGLALAFTVAEVLLVGRGTRR